jgi:hypothetical protein
MESKTKMKFKILLWCAWFAMVSCNSDDRIEGLKSGEILVVTLDISDMDGIEEVSLNTNGNEVRISRDQMGDGKNIKLKTPLLGEGTYRICVYTKMSVLCNAESFAEGGFRPKWKFENKKFEVVESF